MQSICNQFASVSNQKNEEQAQSHSMMRSIFRKEIAAYFSSLVGYLVMAVFLLVSGLVFWVFPETSIPDHGYATMESFFDLVPFLFLFLIPAVSMRSLAGERMEGTLDWLRTKPVTDLAILMGKFLGGFAIILLTLLPTLVYVYSLYVLAQPVGNIDGAGIFASYIGLLLLAASFLSVGLAASAIAPNPVVAFLLSVFVCYILYFSIGFYSMQVPFGAMGRGVVDSRDLVYFLSISFFFLLIAHSFLVGVRRGRGLIRSLFSLKMISLLSMLLAVNYAGTVFHGRVDFTSENRYGLSPFTRATLSELDRPLQIRVLLDGNLPPGFQHLRKATADFLADLRAAAPGRMVRTVFDNPSSGTASEREEQRRALEEKGIFPTAISTRNPDGSISQQLVYPMALVSDGRQELAVGLLQGRMGDAPERTLNQSIENLEYVFVSAIRKLNRGRRSVIGFTEGHGELSDAELHDAMHSLADAHQVGRIDLGVISLEGLAQLDVLVVAKPTIPFSEAEKYKLDYFLMNGGNLVWAIDQLDGSLDSLREGNVDRQQVLSRELSLDDQLFTYGVRLNHDLLIDLNCHAIPMTTESGTGTGGKMGHRSPMEWMPWPLHPVFVPISDHPVVRNLDGLLGEYAGTLDTLALEGVRKEILLQSSPFIRVVRPPVDIALSMVGDMPAPEDLKTSPRPVVALLEGRFPSAFLNRAVPAGVVSAEPGTQPPENVAERGLPARMVVIADGDLIRNQVNPTDGSPYPLGWDRYTGQQFGNRTFLLNLMDYMTDDPALIGLRANEVELRLLDRLRIQEERRYWQVLNVVLPLALLTLIGGLQFYLRRRRYTQTGT